MSRSNVLFVTTCAVAFTLAGCTTTATNAGSSITRSSFNNTSPAPAATDSSPAPIVAITSAPASASTQAASPSAIVFERPASTAVQTEPAPDMPLQETHAATPAPATPFAPSPGTARQAATTHTHPAALALLNEATRQEKSGELEMAAAKLERALKIEPRSALLWHKLANVRLRQGQKQLAANLAAKSNSYTTSDDELVDLNQKIIARATSR